MLGDLEPAAKTAVANNNLEICGVPVDELENTEEMTIRIRREMEVNLSEDDISLSNHSWKEAWHPVYLSKFTRRNTKRQLYTCSFSLLFNNNVNIYCQHER